MTEHRPPSTEDCGVKTVETLGDNKIIHKKKKEEALRKSCIMEVQTLQSVRVDPEQLIGIDWCLGEIGIK